MRRLLAACLISLLGYGILFGWVLDRPLSLGFLQQQIDAKLTRAATIAEPKLVILAGSNGPYSHRCEHIEAIVAMPCVNAGVAVGVGLDYLFARWKPLLRPGDLIYLPMEEAQYTRSRAATELGPDAAIMFRHDWQTLSVLSPARWLAASFAFDLRSALMSGIEAGLLALHFDDPRAELTGTTNAWGDHVGHSETLAATSQSMLAALTFHHATEEQIRTGYGSRLIAEFVRWAAQHGIRTIGGLPTEFADTPIPDASLDAIRSVYHDNGGAFLLLPNHSLYPRTAFFDTAEHLNETWQIIHSELVAKTLVQLLAPTPRDAVSVAGPHARR